MNKQIRISVLPIVLWPVSLLMAQDLHPMPTDPAAQEGSSFSAKGTCLIPVRITYKPRGWFEAELLLDEGAAGITQTAQKVGNK